MNGWKRVPDTVQAKIQVGDYLHRCPEYSHTTVLRLARHIEVNQIENVYKELERLQQVDYVNPVVYELSLRKKKEPRITRVAQWLPS